MATVVAAGIDQWSPAWRVDRESTAGRLLDSLATVRSARGRLLPGEVSGYRVGWIAGASMLYAEGHPSPGGLGSPDRLPEAYRDLTRALVAAGVPVPPGDAMDDLYGDRADGFVGVRRVDATVDLSFENGAEGIAVLAGVAAVAASGLGHAELRVGRDGGVETVYFRGRAGHTVLGRWYDKGLQAGSARRGCLIRPEDQRRYAKGSRRAVVELSSVYVRSQFQRRFVSLYKASKGVTVAGPIVIAEKLAAAVQAGDITARQAEALAGFLLMQAVSRGREVYREALPELVRDADGSVSGVPPAPRPRGISRRTMYRRRADALALGLVLADGVLQEVEVNLHDVLGQCLDSDCWGAQG